MVRIVGGITLIVVGAAFMLTGIERAMFALVLAGFAIAGVGVVALKK